MAKREKPAIIVKHGVPDWLVTFGDMMSLLLTFFILLFSVSEIREESKIYDLVVTFQGKVPQKRPVYGFNLPRFELSPDGLMRDMEDEPGEIGDAGVSRKRVPHPEGEHTHAYSIGTNLYLRLAGKVHFAEGEHFLLDDGREVLGHLAQAELGSGRVRIVVLGHAARGESTEEDGDYWLGFRRARSVRDYLVGLGIPENGVEIQSAGSRQPLRRNGGSPEALALDRRVQILLSPQAVGAAPEG